MRLEEPHQSFIRCPIVGFLQSPRVSFERCHDQEQRGSVETISVSPSPSPDVLAMSPWGPGVNSL
jgi:hypothetical protein